MNFTEVETVASAIQNLKDADLRRRDNRALIDSLYNGAPPFSQKEEQENHIRVNVNWGEGADIILKAREQYENAFLSSDLYFKVHVPNAPKSKKTMIEGELTQLSNRLMKGNRAYMHTEREKWSSVSLHGVGPRMWEDQWKWRPYFVAVPDLLIPTDTELTFDSLNHFAARRFLTAGQLFRKTFGRAEDKRDPGWDMEAVRKVLDNYKDLVQNPNNYNWADHPEQMVQLWKQNSAQLDNDAVPKIWLWDFYYQDDESDSPAWYRKMILDNDCVAASRNFGAEKSKFIYDHKRPFAQSIDNILHVQFCDGNNVPPFMYHSTRGLGQRLYDTVQMLNRLRCQFMQKVFDDMMHLFHIEDPVDRARLDQIYIGLNYGAFPQGLRFLTREERYTPDAKLVEMQMSNLKQLLGEGSAQYTSDIDTGTAKEQTAYEVATKLNQATKLTGSMLNLAYIQEVFAYREICRRLTLPNSPEWDVKKFQNDCLKAGVPEEWINSERWEIEVVRTLGSGNTQLEAAQAQALMSVRPLMNPEAQNEVLHDFVFSITHDPKRANRLAPLDAAMPVTDTIANTEELAAAWLQTAVQPKPGLNPIEAIETMLKKMTEAVEVIQQNGGVATDKEQVNGLVMAGSYTQQWIAQLAQDKTQKQRVKQYSDALGKLMNMVKAFAQRWQEQQQKQNGNGMNPETMQKLQANQLLTQQKLQSKKLTDAQKMQQKNQAFLADQGRKNLKTMSDIHHTAMQTGINALRQPSNPMSEE